MNNSKDDSSFPRPGSAAYNLIVAKKEDELKSLQGWRRMNKYVTIPFYRIGVFPLLGVGRYILLLFNKGAKTGKERITPVEYRRKDEVVHIFSARGTKAHWYKNLIANPNDVKVRIGFRKFAVKFEIIEDIAVKNELFQWYVIQFPKAAEMLFGWDPKKDDPNTVDFTSFSKAVEVLKLFPRKN
jgi:deazaflavin-dependent oxidoreductase (nitroreductase family)